MELKYGTDFAIDTDNVPAASLVALVQRGFNHILGNEVAAKVTRWKADYAEEHGGDEPSDAEVTTYTFDARQAMVERIVKGTLGVRVVGPRGTALETIMRQIAVERLTAALKAKGTKMPTGKDIVVVGGKEYDRTGLIAAHLAKNDAVIRAEAKRRMAQSEETEDLV